jgi:hypothetical protein
VLWRAIAQSPDNDWLRRDAQRRLVQLDALDQIDQLEGVVGRARAAGAGAPWSWPLLVEKGLLTGIPLDPTGVPYVIDVDTGGVDVARQSSLWPLPKEPHTLSSMSRGPS